MIACFGKTAKCYYAGYCGYITHAVAGTEFPSLYIHVYISALLSLPAFFPALQTYYGVNSTLSVRRPSYKNNVCGFHHFLWRFPTDIIDTLITGVFLIPLFNMNELYRVPVYPFATFLCTYTHLKMPCRHMPWIIDLVENFIVYKTIKPIHTILVFHWLGSMSSACYHVERSYFCHRMQYIAQAEQWISISNTGTLEKTSDKNRLPNFCT